MPLPSDAIALDSQQSKLPADAIALDSSNKDMVQSSFEQAHPFMATAEHVADIPFRAANSALFGWPKFALEASGGTIPQEPDSVMKNLGTAADIGGFMFNPLNRLLPMTGLANAAKQGIAATALWAPEKGDSAVDTLKNKAVSAPLAAMTPGLIHGGAEAFTNIPSSMRGFSARLSDNLVRLPKKAFNYAKDPMAIFTKENIVANNSEGYVKAAEDRLNQRVSELNQKVASNPARLNLTDPINEEIDNRLADVAKSTSKTLREAKTQELMDLKAELNGRNLQDMSIQDAIDLKRQLAKDYPFAYTEPKTSTANTLPATVHTIHHSINEAIDKVAPEVSDLNQRVSGLIDISQAAKNRYIVESRNNPIGLSGTLGSVAGAISGTTHGGATEGLLAAIGVPLTMKALSSPAVMTRVAAALSKMSDIDKIQVFKAYPFLKDKIAGMMAGKQKTLNQFESVPLGLPSPEPLPQYLQDRQIVPPMRSPQGEAFSENAIPMGSSIPTPKGIGYTPSPAPIETPQYLKDRTNIPNPFDPHKGVIFGERPSKPYTPGPEAIITTGKEGIKEPPKVTSETKQEAKRQIDAIWYKKLTGQDLPSTVKKAAVIGGATALGAGMFENKADAKQNIDIKKINQIESSGNPEKVGDDGKAFGLNQIHAGTLKDYNKVNKTNYTTDDLMSADINDKVADWYLNKEIPRMIMAYGKQDNMRNRIIAYNAGIKYVKTGKPIPSTTKEYLKKYGL